MFWTPQFRAIEKSHVVAFRGISGDIRDLAVHEVDIIIDLGSTLVPIEIKCMFMHGGTFERLLAFSNSRREAIICLRKSPRFL